VGRATATFPVPQRRQCPRATTPPSLQGMHADRCARREERAAMKLCRRSIQNGAGRADPPTGGARHPV